MWNPLFALKVIANDSEPSSRPITRSLLVTGAFLDNRSIKALYRACSRYIKMCSLLSKLLPQWALFIKAASVRSDCKTSAHKFHQRFPCSAVSSQAPVRAHSDPSLGSDSPKEKKQSKHCVCVFIHYSCFAVFEKFLFMPTKNKSALQSRMEKYISSAMFRNKGLIITGFHLVL